MAEDGFEIIQMESSLQSNSDNPSALDIGLALNSLPEKNSILVSVQPPLKPIEDIRHVPCDIVLVIDVSGSMSRSAPIPTNDETEETGLSILDLTKHAARTIIETLNEKDRLAVITFASEIDVAFNLDFMNVKNKEKAWKAVEAKTPRDLTNLWHGIREGLQTLEHATPLPQNNQAIFVLTDGLPNYMCPSQGYIPKLRRTLQIHKSRTETLPSIHTFGFGYSLRSGLLQSISEVGTGNFAFIPDAGMIGTVFVHAIANLYATFVSQAKLTFKLGNSSILQVADGSKTGLDLEETQPTPGEASVVLGNLQYGQSRDILLHYEKTTKDLSHNIEAKLTYNFHGETRSIAVNQSIDRQTMSLSPEIYDYHHSRSRICAYLRSLYPLESNGEYCHIDSEDLPYKQKGLEPLIQDLQALGHTDEDNKSLLQDLVGESPEGQISLAMSSEEYFNRWGRHYLLSILNAHTHQICNSFKDPGPLRYGKHSPLFCTCREELDDCFDTLPAPTPSILSSDGSRAAPVHMSRYNFSQAPCFTGECRVRMLQDDHNDIAVHDLRPGMGVWTPYGTRYINAVVETQVSDIYLCKVGSLKITPWHPIQTEEGMWIFPWEEAKETVCFDGRIYSILLEPDSNPEAHAIMVENHLCVTLGHGIRSGNDVRAHEFLGDHSSVSKDLALLPRCTNGVSQCSGMKRHLETGHVSGFSAPEIYTTHGSSAKNGVLPRANVPERADVPLFPSLVT